MTYSIVARDRRTGAIGVAVQSHWFSVGALVPWAEAGVGGVATQANVELSYGPRALDLLRAGGPPAEVLADLTAADPQAEFRQVAVVDAGGRVSVHTGSGCIPYAGHTTGDGFACQANLMASAQVWPAMAAAFAASDASLPYRLLAALDAGEAAGGDVRGKQSAAVLVAPGEGEGWERVVDLRVEDHPEPLAELRRLLVLHDAYLLAGEGDRLVSQGNLAEAADRFISAQALASDNAELAFWAGLSLVAQGEVDPGVDYLRGAIAAHAGWGDLLARLDAASAPGVEEARRLLA